MSHPNPPTDVREALLAFRPEVVLWMDRWGHQYADREDLAQIVMARVTGAADQYDPSRGALKTWVYVTARSVSIRHAENQERLATTVWSELSDRRRISAPAPSPEEQFANKQALRFALRLLRGVLRDDEYNLLLAAELDGLDEEELAMVFDLPGGTVRSRLHRARMKAKRCLQGRRHELLNLLPGVFAERDTSKSWLPWLLLIPAAGVPGFLLGRAQSDVPLTAAASRLHVNVTLTAGAGASAAPSAQPAAQPLPMQLVDMSKPRALAREIERSVARGDKADARAHLLRYLEAYPGDPLRVRQRFGWLLRP
jgi:RNA polymerase sigma-70 factor (ECF subfamily)